MNATMLKINTQFNPRPGNRMTKNAASSANMPYTLENSLTLVKDPIGFSRGERVVAIKNDNAYYSRKGSEQNTCL